MTTDKAPGIDEQIAIVSRNIESHKKHPNHGTLLREKQAILATLLDYKRITEVVMPEEPGFLPVMRKLAAKNLSGSEDALLIAYIDTLRAVAMKNSGDAERYRWLRHRDVTFEAEEGPEFISYIPELGHDGSKLDFAIDAEIEKARGG